MPIFPFLFGRVESNIGHMVMAKGGRTIWILLVKFLECKLGADLMYPCGTYVWKFIQHSSVIEVNMILTVYGSGLELLNVIALLR